MFNEEFWTQVICEILFKLKNVLIKLCQYIVHHIGPVFWDTDRQASTAVMETARLVLSQFENFFNVVTWELNKVYPYQK